MITISSIERIEGRGLFMTTPYLPEEFVPSGVAKFAEQFCSSVPGVVLLKFGAGVRGIRQVIIFRQILRILENIGAKISPIVHVNTAAESKAILRDLLLVLVIRVLARHASVVIHIHGGAYTTDKPSAITKLFFLVMFKCCDHCIILQKGALDFLLSGKANGDSENKVSVIDNFTSLFMTRDYSEFIAVDSFVYMGRLSKEKRILELVHTFGEFVSLGYSEKLYIVGDGPLWFDVKSLIENSYLEESVILCGALFGNEKQKILSQCRYLVLNSVYEGMPMVVLEAMGLSLIPIVTPVGALPSMIGNSVGGCSNRRGYFVHKDGVVVSDLEVISQVDTEILYEISCRAHDYAFYNYSPSRVIPRFLECYSNLDNPG